MFSTNFSFVLLTILNNTIITIFKKFIKFLFRINQTLIFLISIISINSFKNYCFIKNIRFPNINVTIETKKKKLKFSKFKLTFKIIITTNVVITAITIFVVTTFMIFLLFITVTPPLSK